MRNLAHPWRSDTAQRVLMVRVHPVRESFLQAAGDRAASGITRAGHELRELDLYGEGFDPLLSEHDLGRRHSDTRPEPDHQRHAEALQWANHLVLVYPTWFGGFPAMLKGWLECVWTAQITREFRDGLHRTPTPLRHVTRLTVVTTHGGSKLMNSLGGEPGRRMVRRGLRSMCSLRCQTRWVAFYGNDHSTSADRREFLDRVERHFAR